MKFYESGKQSQIMPSGHITRALPRENFQAKAAPPTKATVPPSGAQSAAIVQALRGAANPPGKGLSPPPGQGIQSRIVSKLRGPK
jgi:hypothetical protein